MGLKSIAKKPGSDFNSYLLSIEENWWAREHPFNMRVVRVKAAARSVTELEDALEEARATLEQALVAMNEERINA